MKFYQRTGFSDSTAFFGGGNNDLPTMGLGQGSRAAPASWLQLSAFVVNIYKKLEYGASINLPLTEEKWNLWAHRLSTTQTFTSGKKSATT